MDLQELLVAARRRPFIPFRLTLTEGSQYDVKHPEFCMVGKRSVMLVLGDGARDSPIRRVGFRRAAR